MDVDFGGAGGGGASDDITSDLLQKFSCMNTNDREVLIQQFKVLLGENCPDSNAEFWLDMNNWNLQAAICSYFDNESSTSGFLLKLPSIQIVSNSPTIEELQPNSSFFYSCTVVNTGDEPWPLGCSLRFSGGTQMCNDERFLLPSLTPSQTGEIKLSMIAPDKPGVYQSQWRPATLTGQFFGEILFIIVNVEDDLQNVTQQLSAAHLDQTMSSSSVFHLSPNANNQLMCVPGSEMQHQFGAGIPPSNQSAISSVSPQNFGNTRLPNPMAATNTVLNVNNSLTQHDHSHQTTSANNGNNSLMTSDTIDDTMS